MSSIIKILFLSIFITVCICEGGEKTNEQRNEMVGGSNPLFANDDDEPVLTMSRRDVSERRKELCQNCRNSSLCKNPKRCKTLCRGVCRGLDDENNNATFTTIAPESATTMPLKQSVDSNNIPETIVGARFGEEVAATPSYNRYYTLGAFTPGPTMNLVAKLLGVTDVNAIDRLIVLVQTKVAQPPIQDPDILDTAKVFSQNENITPHIQRLDGKDIRNPDLMVEFNKAIDQAIENRRVNGQLNQTGYDLAVNDALQMMYGNSTFSDILGCKKKDDEEYVPLIPMQPPIEYVPHVSYPTYSKKAQDDNNRGGGDLENLPKNPPVIQGNLDPNMVERGQFNKPQDGGRTLQSENLLKRESSEEKDSGEVVAPTTPQPVEDITQTPQPIGENVIKIVQDNLNQTEQEFQRVENTLRDVERTIQDFGNRRPITRLRDQSRRGRPLMANNNIRNFKVAEAAPQELPPKDKPQQGPIVSPFDGDIIGSQKQQPNQIRKIPYPLTNQNKVLQSQNPLIDQSEQISSPNFNGRLSPDPLAKTTDNKPHAGMIVPDRSYSDPTHRTSKLVFVGNGIQLPLQMEQEKDGRLQLSIDVDKMCNCKNKTCPAPHPIDPQHPDDDENNLDVDEHPRLDVRFNEEQDEINQRSQRSEKSKRSPRIVDSDKNYYKLKKIEEELEHKLDELNKNVNEYREEKDDTTFGDRSARSIRNRMDAFSDFLKLLKRATL